jgi:hypothetical protein
MILGMDPAVSARNATGVALANPHLRRIVAVGIIRRNPDLDELVAWDDIARRAVAWAHANRPTMEQLTGFVTEMPVVYPDEQIDPNVALTPLVGVLACVSGLLRPNVSRTIYRPREWKGTLDKATFTSRILDRLDPAERKLVDAVMPAGLRHNATDAVGLLLKFLGRMERVRVVHNEA